MLRLALLLALVALPAWADRSGNGRGGDHDRARAAVSAGEILPLATLLPALEARFRARLIEVDLEGDDGRLIYEIEMITAAGRILEVEIDATSGAILEAGEDDED